MDQLLLKYLEIEKKLQNQKIISSLNNEKHFNVLTFFFFFSLISIGFHTLYILKVEADSILLFYTFNFISVFMFLFLASSDFANKNYYWLKFGYCFFKRSLFISIFPFFVLFFVSKLSYFEFFYNIDVYFLISFSFSISNVINTAFSSLTNTYVNKKYEHNEKEEVNLLKEKELIINKVKKSSNLKIEVLENKRQRREFIDLFSEIFNDEELIEMVKAKEHLNKALKIENE